MNEWECKRERQNEGQKDRERQRERRQAQQERRSASVEAEILQKMNMHNKSVWKFIGLMILQVDRIRSKAVKSWKFFKF